MHAKLAALSLFALGAGSLAACASYQAEPLPEPIALPVRTEPKFQPGSYSALPSGTHMTVQRSTDEMAARLKQEFPALASNRAALNLVEERLVVSDGVPYRRVWFSYGDEATSTMHGPCSQNIYIWLKASGEEAGAYVEPLACPI